MESEAREKLVPCSWPLQSSWSERIAEVSHLVKAEESTVQQRDREKEIGTHENLIFVHLSMN